MVHGLTPHTWGLGFRITFYLLLGKLEAADLNIIGCCEWCDQKHSDQKKVVGENPYTEELLQLEQCAPTVARPIAPHLAVIKTPLKVRAWEQALAQHPEWWICEVCVAGHYWGIQNWV